MTERKRTSREMFPEPRSAEEYLELQGTESPSGHDRKFRGGLPDHTSTEQRRAIAHRGLCERGWRCLWSNKAYSEPVAPSILHKPESRFEMYNKGAALLIVQTRLPDGGVEIWRPVTSSGEWDATWDAVDQYADEVNDRLREPRTTPLPVPGDANYINRDPVAPTLCPCGRKAGEHHHPNCNAPVPCEDDEYDANTAAGL